MAMTYTVFGHRISSLNICNTYGLKEKDIARCYSDADADKDKASVLIESLIKAKTKEELSKEFCRRAGMRSHRNHTVQRPELAIQTIGCTDNKCDVETDYFRL